MTFHTSFGLILRSRDFALPFCQIQESSHCTLTGRFLAESSLTKRAAVANISSPITAWSGCIWKTKLINKQIILSQDPWLLACLNKWLVPPTYVQDIGAVLAKLVLSFEHGQSLKKIKFSLWLLYFQSVTKLLNVQDITEREWWKVVSGPWKHTEGTNSHTDSQKYRSTTSAFPLLFLDCCSNDFVFLFS